MSRFDGKVALITGGRSGIGAACASALAAEGAHVITAQRGEDPVHDWIAVDFIGPEAPATLVKDVIKRTGRLDILVNNAGLMREGTALEMSVQDWSDTIQVNLTAPFLLIKHALPHLIPAGGVIVNIGSIEGSGANPRHPAYCASKGGLHALTRA
ncbi:MAG: SDR family NAD(P)-dependent oxidoreductase, partial [Geminicoccaceae bacterium]